MSVETQTEKRLKAADHISKFLNIPYMWGGDDPSGFDCSGLIMEILQSVGHLPRNIDMTANQLYLRYQNKPSEAKAGCLVFWFNDVGKAVHVEMLIDQHSVIGASGGGSKTTTLKKAIKHNAFIKMNSLNYRGLNYKIIDPFIVLGL